MITPLDRNPASQRAVFITIADTWPVAILVGVAGHVEKARKHMSKENDDQHKEVHRHVLHQICERVLVFLHNALELCKSHHFRHPRKAQNLHSLQVVSYFLVGISLHGVADPLHRHARDEVYSKPSFKVVDGDFARLILSLVTRLIVLGGSELQRKISDEVDVHEIIDPEPRAREGYVDLKADAVRDRECNVEQQE